MFPYTISFNNEKLGSLTVLEDKATACKSQGGEVPCIVKVAFG